MAQEPSLVNILLPSGRKYRVSLCFRLTEFQAIHVSKVHLKVTSMATVTSLSRLTLDLPPSCIAFCPTAPQFFVVGTYFLHPTNDEKQHTDRGAHGTHDGEDSSSETVPTSQQRRCGSLILFQLAEDGVATCASDEPLPFMNPRY